MNTWGGVVVPPMTTAVTMDAHPPDPNCGLTNIVISRTPS